jgi:NAD(P)-dependent dehydrogenase (short-subunit alcohol dehydrogenase family)
MPPLKSIEMKPEKHGYGTIFTRSQFCAKPQYPSKMTDLSGKVAIVTGSNTGLGLSCCHQHLNLKLSHLILAVRSIEKGEAAASQLRRSSPSAKIEIWELEMGSYDSILAVSRRAEQLQRLDIAILNAGIIKIEFHRNATTSHEDMVQVNYLSTMLLAILLLPTLKTKSPQGFPGRLTIVGSSTVFAAKFKNRNAKPLLASFDSTNAIPWDPIEWYPCSKLLGHLFLVRFVDYVNADDVIVNIVDPGYCKGSQLHREATGVVGALVSFSKTLTARSLEVGASTYIDAAVVKGKESHGCWLMDWKIKP